MHQDAFPGEDISDRPEPATVVPALLALIGSDRPSGRIRLAELVPSGRVIVTPATALAGDRDAGPGPAVRPRQLPLPPELGGLGPARGTRA